MITPDAAVRDAMVTATAMSLYQYNVSALERARRLDEHFAGNCSEMADLLRYVDSTYWATEMPFPTAWVYLRQAMEQYGDEAEARVDFAVDHMRHFR